MFINLTFVQTSPDKSANDIFIACATDGRGYLYAYGWHLQDLYFTALSQQYALSTSIRIGCNSYNKICVRVHMIKM